MLPSSMLHRPVCWSHRTAGATNAFVAENRDKDIEAYYNAIWHPRKCLTDARLACSLPQAGAALALFAEGADALLGADQAGALRRRAEAIGRFVARNLLEDLDRGATVDRPLADQLIIFAALAAGTSTLRLPQVTEHVQTNCWLVETLLGARTHLEGQ